VRLCPTLRDVLAAHKARASTIDPGTYVFGTAQGKPQSPSNVRTRVLNKSVERANERLRDARAARAAASHPARAPPDVRVRAVRDRHGPREVMDEMGYTDECWL
jgi:hypothetical protein